MAVPHVPHLEQPAVPPLVDISLNLHQLSLSMETEVATGVDRKPEIDVRQ